MTCRERGARGGEKEGIKSLSRRPHYGGPVVDSKRLERATLLFLVNWKSNVRNGEKEDMFVEAVLIAQHDSAKNEGCQSLTTQTLCTAKGTASKRCTTEAVLHT